MHFHVHRLDLAYEMPFVRPVLKVAQSAVQILECFYDALSPRFFISLGDLQASGGASMADVGARIILFNGDGVIEVGPGRLVARFEKLQTEQHVTLVTDCIRLSEDALRKALPDTQPRSAKITTYSWLTCDEKDEAVASILGSQIPAGLSMAAEEFGATNLDYYPRVEIASGTEGWEVRFALERSRLEGSDLFFICDAEYAEGGQYSSLDERAQHLRKSYLYFLRQFNLVPSESTNTS